MRETWVCRDLESRRPPAWEANAAILADVETTQGEVLSAPTGARGAGLTRAHGPPHHGDVERQGVGQGRNGVFRALSGCLDGVLELATRGAQVDLFQAGARLLGGC